MTNIIKKGRGLAALRAGAAAIALVASANAYAAEEASAQSAPAAEAENDSVIVVTARHREEKAQDVPVALSVVGAATLENSGNYTINQIQNLVPTLQTTSLNPRNSNINVRGLGSNSSVALDGLESGVGFYVDGVYYARPGQAQFDLIDIERIEVLQGPQGTLFGKNTTAGAINITTKLPSFSPEATIEGSYGNYHYYQIRGSVSLPIVSDKIAARLSFADTQRDGFLHNRLDGRDGQDYHNYTVRGQLLIKPTETLSVRIIGDYASNKQRSISVPGNYFTTYANGATIPNNIFVRAARTGYTLTPNDPFARQVDLDADYYFNSKSYGVSGEVNWDLGHNTLTSITAYRWWDWYPNNDIDNTSLNVQQGGLNDFQRQFSQELRLASSGTNKIDYVAGLYYFWQTVRGVGNSRFGSDYAAFNLNPATTPAATIDITNRALSGFEADYVSDPRTKSYAAFGQVDWHITSKLTATGGLRYTHEDKDGYFREVWTKGLDISTLTPAQQAIATAARAVAPILDFTSSLKDDAVSGLFTLAYKPTSDILLYGTYAHGSKSGGLNLTVAGAFRPVIKPEKENSYELGFKSQFLDHKLTLNGSLFQTDVKDYQGTVTELVGTTTTTRSYIANVPKVRSRGAELDAIWAPSKWVSLTASGAYTDAKYVSYPNAPQAVERLNVSAIQDLSGVQLPYISKFVYSLALDVAQPVGDYEAYGRADYSHRSSTNASSNNSIYGIIPAYGLINLRVGARTENRRWDLSAFVRNLTNENYLLSRTPGTFGVITSLLGDPRTYGATLRVKF